MTMPAAVTGQMVSRPVYSRASGMRGSLILEVIIFGVIHNGENHSQVNCLFY